MAKAKKENRHSRSDLLFVRGLFRHLKRVATHDAAISQQTDLSISSPVPIIDDGPDGPHAQALIKFSNRLSDLYTYWTGKPIG